MPDDKARRSSAGGSALSGLAGRLRAKLRAARFAGSSGYWERRYRAGKTSGAGSYGRLAAFKADTINRLVAEQGIRTVIELGCGDGAQLALARYPAYVGVDVSAKAVALCRERFAESPAYRFFQADDRAAYWGAYDLALSLDVIYHLVEDEIFEAYIDDLFALSNDWVAIYSSDSDEPSAYPHVRHRRVVDHVAARKPNWRLIERIANPYPYDPDDPGNTSFADFFIYRRAAG